MKPSPKKPQRRFSGVHREDPASDKRGWCEGANSQDNIQRQISLLMCWNTIRLQKSMKQSSNIDLGVTREQLEGYYREIVCKWGEISEWAFIFYGSSLHVRVLTVIFINPSPVPINISHLFAEKVKSVCVLWCSDLVTAGNVLQSSNIQTLIHACRCVRPHASSALSTEGCVRVCVCVTNSDSEGEIGVLNYCTRGTKIQKNACSLSVSHFEDSFILK